MPEALNFAESIKAHLEGRAEDVPKDYKAICDSTVTTVEAHLRKKIEAEFTGKTEAAADPMKVEAKIVESSNQAKADEKARTTAILKAASAARLGIDQALAQIESGATIDQAKDALIEAAAKEQKPIAPANSYHANPVDMNAEAEFQKKAMAAADEVKKSMGA